MDGSYSDIAIIGAGMAGLACATRLVEAGHSVRVFDKGRGPGGRMASRRAEIDGKTVSFDHGAQYFTARDAGFAQQVNEWETAGVVARWSAASRSADDPAWVGVPGMNGPIRAMALSLEAKGHDVLWSVRIESLKHDGALWQIGAAESAFSAATVLVAIPAEQASELLAQAVPDFSSIAGSVSSQPCWAVMAAFDEKLDIDEDTLRDADAAISWAARNSAKPVRAGEECWVLHASPLRSREIIDLTKEEAASALMSDFFDQTLLSPVAPVHAVAHRWLYAMPESIIGEHARYDAEARIGIAGDYLHSPRVEGAWLSGTALAELVLAR